MKLSAAEEQALKSLLDEKILLYNTPAFIVADPVKIPHRFSQKQDIEIAGFFAATLAWGNRTSIINNCTRLLGWMDNAPHEFILNHRPEDLKPMLGFAHRTFNATDLLYFIETLQRHYSAYDSLESAFFPGAGLDAIGAWGHAPGDLEHDASNLGSYPHEPMDKTAGSSRKVVVPHTSAGEAVPDPNLGSCPHEPTGTAAKPSRKVVVPHTSVGEALIRFNHYFFQGEYPERTRKHVSNPARGSACKRLCMFLRWMVRKDASGVDFGIWTKIGMSDLICPLDVHVARVAHRLGLTSRSNADWRSAIELTNVLRRWRPEDAAVYDYALFGLGMAERF